VIVTRNGVAQVSNNSYEVVLVCSPGKYGVAGQPCQPCPENAACSGGLAMPAARSGAYYDDTTNVFLPCSPAEACIGQPSGAELGDAQCAEGYVSLQCSLCQTRFYRLGTVPGPVFAW
jgi:hypothetical protein